MDAQYLNSLSASFSLFLNHEIQYFSSGFMETSGMLYPQNDPRYSQYNIYASPFSQWISDESITSIPSGIYNNGVFMGRDSGIVMDFLHGRVLYSGTLDTPTASYSIPEFSVYYSDADLDSPDLLIETAFSLTPQIAQVTGGLPYFSQTVPCVMFQNQTQENTAAAIGTKQNANSELNCYVIATNTYQLEATVGILCDTARKYFPLFEVSDLPYTTLGDVKNNNYNYITLSTNQPRQVFINKVRFDKFDEGKNKKIGKTIWGCRVTFDLIYQFDNA